MVGYRPIRVKGLVKLAHAGFSGRCQSDNSPHCQSDKFRQLDVTQFLGASAKFLEVCRMTSRKSPKEGTRNASLFHKAMAKDHRAQLLQRSSAVQGG